VGLVELRQRINKGVTRISELESANKPIPSDWNEHLTKLINEYKTITVRTLLDEINEIYPVGLFAWLNENYKSLYNQNIEIENKVNDLLSDNNVDISEFEVTANQLKEWYTNAISLYNNEYDSVLIHSEKLNKDIWICSNNSMVEQVKIDDPESVVYHINEIVKINKLKPDIKGLKSIHQVKKIFRNSKVVATNKQKY